MTVNVMADGFFFNFAHSDKTIILWENVKSNISDSSSCLQVIFGQTMQGMQVFEL